MARTYTFTFTFPEAPAAHACKSVTASGSTLNVALSRAAVQVAKDPHLKGRRLTCGRISFALHTPTPTDTGD